MGSIPTYSRHEERRNDVKNEQMRKIPKVDEVLQHVSLEQVKAEIPHSLLLFAVRAVADDLRARILKGEPVPEGAFGCDSIAAKAKALAEKEFAASLRPVINATGVPLHTNLGRAPLSAAARQAVDQAASSYCNLEYDIERGERGSRHAHLEYLIRRITGAEAALVVNNNAAATLLCLAALSRGRECVISRGELVEIGGSFRIPEIMAESGAILVEVGTTNKTRLSDYRARLNEETGLILKVHTSNYRITGFTEEASLEELVRLGREAGLPVVYDLGSGLMTELKGIGEPNVADGLRAGADVVMFSGDKLLGGPQSGILIGKKAYIAKMKQYPLARAFRVDKLTIAALEATFRAYYEDARACREIPVLRMLQTPAEELLLRAGALAARLSEIPGVKAEAVVTENEIGGGSGPGVSLPGAATAVRVGGLTANALEKKLRTGERSVVGRIAGGKLLLELRTILPEEEDLLAECVRNAAEGKEA